MKVLMLLGSPHSDGTTAALASEFERGAEEAGNEVVKIECARLKVNPCIGCGNCLRHGVCVWTDDMPKVEKAVRECDAIVYVTPVYYAGVTSQLKLVMDRFYSFNSVFKERRPALGLITAAHEPVSSSTNAVILHFHEIVKYVGSRDLGMVNAVGVGTAEDLKGTDFLSKAYGLGRSVH